MMEMTSPVGPRMMIDGRTVDYFAGTSYHTLHGHPAVMQAAMDAIRRFGIGPATHARVAPYEELRCLLADHFQCEAPVVVGSGYLAIAALLLGLRNDYDIIFADSLSHYSVREGLRLTEKRVVYFRHCDPDDLVQKLKAHLKAGQIPLILSEGVFPMTGALAPVDAYARIAQDFPGALLCIDDAHGVGVMGKTGQGTAQHFGVSGDNIFFAGTLSKAFGAFGGVIPCDARLAAKISANAGVIRGASWPPVSEVAAAAASVALFRSQPEMLSNLRDNVWRARSGFRALGLEIAETGVPIISLRAKADLAGVCADLKARDVIVKHLPAGSYSDAPEQDTLRIAIFSSHSPDQIDRLVEAVAACL